MNGLATMTPKCMDRVPSASSRGGARTAEHMLAQLFDVFGPKRARASRLEAAGGTQRRPASGFAARRFGTTQDDSKRRRNTRSRGHFGAIPPICPISNIPKGAHMQGFLDAGGGTRTPDTRIMIPLL
jgi:hypothetical protein